MKETKGTIQRCEHGVFLPQGQVKSYGCQFCNSELNSHPLSSRRARADHELGNKGDIRERELDLFQLVTAATGLRIAAGFSMLEAHEA